MQLYLSHYKKKNLFNLTSFLLEHVLHLIEFWTSGQLMPNDSTYMTRLSQWSRWFSNLCTNFGHCHNWFFFPYLDMYVDCGFCGGN